MLRIFKFVYEEELKKYLKDNFEKLFGFSFVAEELSVITGKVDLVGEDNENIYLIEIKRDYVTKETIKQLQKYVDAYDSDKKVIGIAVAPKVKRDIVVSDNIIVMSLENIAKNDIGKINIGIDNELFRKIKIKATMNNRTLTKEIEIALKKHTADIELDKLIKKID